MIEETWLDDQRLIRGLRAHDPRSLEALIQHYSRELFYLACLILAGVGAAQDAEECLNDLFVTVWQEFDAFDPARGSLRTWLIMRTKYIALDCRRQLLRRQHADVPVVILHEEYSLAQEQRSLASLAYQQKAYSQLTTAGVDVLLEQQERYEELRCALEQLPTFDRLLIYRRYFQFTSIKELAACTGLTKHAVEARLWRARKVLREALQQQGPGIAIKRTTMRAGRKRSFLRKEGWLI
ncbi:MAG TPA: sigma-70 family RNA polymerase sigma factor [Ktedonobacterales bacterium]|nr:sigma-70 family RNA polymerase sigma factor [Ktedonobacterales bacterium]